MIRKPSLFAKRSSRTALITGGAGFIGSHLCERLLDRGVNAVCLDNLSTGSWDNISHLEQDPKFSFLYRDVREPLTESTTFDYIFHLASPASPEAYFRMPIDTATVNARGVEEMLEAARRWNARLLLASTSEVYGDPTMHPQGESYFGNVNSVGPRSCYDEGKRYAEALAMAYHRSLGIDVRIVRIFNTYGPRSDPEDGRMVPNFIRQSLLGLPITVYGDGSQTRSLCYVDDLVEGLVRAMLADSIAGEVINLGCPEEYTVLDYAKMIRDGCGSQSEIEFCAAREEDPARRLPNITKARRMLDWEPETAVRSGLESTIDWFRGCLQGAAMTGQVARSRP